MSAVTSATQNPAVSNTTSVAWYTPRPSVGEVTTGPEEPSGIPKVGTNVAVAVGPGSGAAVSAALPTSENATSTVPKLTRLLSGMMSPNARRCGSPRYRSMLAATATIPDELPVGPVGGGG